jgi:cysteine synthase
MIMTNTMQDPAINTGSRELARTENIFVGFSSGATFAGALQVCEQTEKGATILCMLPLSRSIPRMLKRRAPGSRAQRK